MTEQWDRARARLWDKATRNDKEAADLLAPWRTLFEALKAFVGSKSLTDKQLESALPPALPAAARGAACSGPPDDPFDPGETNPGKELDLFPPARLSLAPPLLSSPRNRWSELYRRARQKRDAECSPVHVPPSNRSPVAPVELRHYKGASQIGAGEWCESPSHRVAAGGDDGGQRPHPHRMDLYHAPDNNRSAGRCALLGMEEKRLFAGVRKYTTRFGFRAGGGGRGSPPRGGVIPFTCRPSHDTNRRARATPGNCTKGLREGPRNRAAHSVLYKHSTRGPGTFYALFRSLARQDKHASGQPGGQRVFVEAPGRGEREPRLSKSLKANAESRPPVTEMLAQSWIDKTLKQASQVQLQNKGRGEAAS
ncbi:uncharacterized protein LOC141959534 [Athene noctua]|uniref:uncharacterized protein LOC141959534 n=1 Tax=Athene noctua TaxID=126797 RepID=UPI003EBAA5B3